MKAELLQLIRNADSLEEFERMLLTPGERETLQRCAVVLAFDRVLYDELLASGGDVEESPDFDQFTRREWCEAVPGKQGVYRLRESTRRQYLSLWLEPRLGRVALATLARRLADHYVARGPAAALHRLNALILAGAPEAEQVFSALYRAADEAFDLARCDELVNLCRERAEWLGFHKRVEEAANYLQARALWAREFHQTAWFHERMNPVASFDALLESEDTWVWQLHAGGGMGKTMLLRWLIARHCVPAPRRYPCARIDFDFVDLVTTSEHFWLLLLKIADQLNCQLPEGPFNSILQKHERALRVLEQQETAGYKTAYAATQFALPAEPVRDAIIEDIKNRLLAIGKPVVVIFDTLEETVLYRPQELLALVRYMERLHADVPRLRLVLAGRYLIKERIPEFATVSGCAEPVEIPRFGDEDARRYLLDKRRVRATQPIDLVIERAHGNPFKLALFADILLCHPGITREELLDYPDDPALLYLVERVLERIDPVTQWVLRYGVIPRRLTPRFLKEVMWKYLQEAMSGQVDYDDPTKDFKERKSFWLREPLQSNTSPEEAWRLLHRYASGSSWVYPMGDQAVIGFHADAAEPMRKLLQDHPISRLLHADAIWYYEGLAEEEPVRWAEWTREALYHRFRLEGAAAGGHWEEKMASALAADSPERQRVLASDLLDLDYVTPEGQPRLLADGRPLISYETLARAAYATVRAELDLFTAPGRQDQIRKHHEAAERYEVLCDEEVLLPIEKVRLRAGLERGSRPAEALRVLEEWADPVRAGGQEPSDEEWLMLARATLQPMQDRLTEQDGARARPFTAEEEGWFGFWLDYADLKGRTAPDTAITLYRRLLRLTEGLEMLSCFRRRVCLALAGQYCGVDRASEAVPLLAMSVQAAAAENDLETADNLRIELMEAYLEDDRLDDAQALIALPTRPLPSGGLSWGHWIRQAEFHLAMLNPQGALFSCAGAEEAPRPYRGEPRPKELARVQELRGRACGQLKQSWQAAKHLDQARELWRNAASPRDELRIILELISLHLDGTGDLDRADALSVRVMGHFHREEDATPAQQVWGRIVQAQVLKRFDQRGRAKEHLQEAIPCAGTSLRMQARLAAHRLALFGGPDAGECIRALIQCDEAGIPWLPLVDPLVGLDLEEAFAHSHPLTWELCSRARPPRSNPQMFVMDTVRLLTLLRWAGDAPAGTGLEPEDLLRRAVQAVVASEAMVPWRALLKAARWLPTWPDTVRQVFRQLEPHAQEFPGWFDTLIAENLEHACHLGDRSLCLQLVRTFKQSPPRRDDRPTQWTARCWELSASVQDQGDGADDSLRAVDIYTDLKDEVSKRRALDLLVPDPDATKAVTELLRKNVTVEIERQEDELILTCAHSDGTARLCPYSLQGHLGMVLRDGGSSPLSALALEWDVQAKYFADFLKDKEFFGDVFDRRDPFDLKLRISSGPLSGFPWEMWLGNGKIPLSLLPALRSLYRTSGRRATGGVRPRRGTVLVLQPSQRRQRVIGRGQALTGVDAATAYQQVGHRVEVLEDPTAAQLRSFLASAGPVQAIHLVAQFRHGDDSTETYLDFSAGGTRYAESLRGEASSLFPCSELATGLRQDLSQTAGPLILLDAIGARNELEAFSQLFLRNEFASDLHRNLGGWPVLATGLGIGDDQLGVLRMLADGLDDGLPTGQLARALRWRGYLARDSTPWISKLSSEGVALFDDRPSAIPQP